MLRNQGSEFWGHNPDTACAFAHHMSALSQENVGFSYKIDKFIRIESTVCETLLAFFDFHHWGEILPFYALSLLGEGFQQRFKSRYIDVSGVVEERTKFEPNIMRIIIFDF